jgi:hypothetical protein
MRCMVCGEDKTPEIRFDVPVICSECARLQLQRIEEEMDEDAPGDLAGDEANDQLV